MKKGMIEWIGLSITFLTFVNTGCEKEDETLLTDIDGNVYNTVQIGTQTWIKENLRTTRFNDGSNISLVTDNLAWSNMTSEGYCWYNNDENTFKESYGALYNWYAVNQDKLCPPGWHVPGDEEWEILADYLGGNYIAGRKLKETGTKHWVVHSRATNESGFTALPGGHRYESGPFYFLGVTGVWWSSTDSDSDNARLWTIMYDNSFYSNNYFKQAGYSVRCVKN
jgi:uncharacterized protein (TIGR02145 family)